MTHPQITIKPRRFSVAVEQSLTTVLQVGRQSAGLSTADFKTQALSGFPLPHTEFDPLDQDGNITAIKTWDSTSKTTLLLTQAFSYVDGNLSAIVLTNGRTGATLTRSFNYTAGELTGWTFS
jgi:hypothetical protein